MLEEGVTIFSSGTTGPPKEIFRTPQNLKACNEVAVDAQRITKNSKVYTVCKMTHAGGLLAQTLPAISIGAEVVVEDFNAFRWVREIHKYTHTHLAPGHVDAVIQTKGFKDLDLRGIWVTCGSDCVQPYMIEFFVRQGATFMANWGMSEIGPIVINKTFYDVDQIGATNILGDTFYCDWKIIDSELVVKSDQCIYDDWFHTKDLVYLDGPERYMSNHTMYIHDRLI